MIILTVKCWKPMCFQCRNLLLLREEQQNSLASFSSFRLSGSDQHDTCGESISKFEKLLLIFSRSQKQLIVAV